MRAKENNPALTCNVSLKNTRDEKKANFLEGVAQQARFVATAKVVCTLEQVREQKI